MPAVVIEGGFLSNESDRQVLVTDEYQKKLANGIVNGILQFLEEADLPASQYDFNAAA
jgi:N-acetylmuramoyl-L-alanine amidase